MVATRNKKVSPTCINLYKAVVGDILEVSRVLYRVEGIQWIANATRKHSVVPANQRLQVTRLADGEEEFLTRGVADTQGFLIQTPADWIGKEVIGKGIAL